MVYFFIFYYLIELATVSRKHIHCRQNPSRQQLVEFVFSSSSMKEISNREKIFLLQVFKVKKRIRNVNWCSTLM